MLPGSVPGTRWAVSFAEANEGFSSWLRWSLASELRIQMRPQRKRERREKRRPGFTVSAPCMSSISARPKAKSFPELTEVRGDVAGYRERLVTFVEAQGITLNYSQHIAPAKGMSYGGRITLLPEMQPAEEFCTLVHEIGHELLHRGERRTLTTKQVPETEDGSRRFRGFSGDWLGNGNQFRRLHSALAWRRAPPARKPRSRSTDRCRDSRRNCPRTRNTASVAWFTTIHTMRRTARAVRRPPHTNQKFRKGENGMSTTEAVIANHEYQNLPITVLVESPTNPRKRFDETALQELAESFKAQGVLAPLLVREREDRSYEVIAGAAALRAARIAELSQLGSVTHTTS